MKLSFSKKALNVLLSIVLVVGLAPTVAWGDRQGDPTQVDPAAQGQIDAGQATDPAAAASGDSAEGDSAADSVAQEPIESDGQDEGTASDKATQKSKDAADKAAQDASSEKAAEEADSETTKPVTLRAEVATDDGQKVAIVLTADAGVFEGDNLELSVDYVNPEADSSTADAIDAAVSEAKSQAGDASNVAKRMSFDIKVLANGAEVQPDTAKGAVKVAFVLPDAPTGADGAAVYHTKNGRAEKAASRALAQELAAQAGTSAADVAKSDVSAKAAGALSDEGAAEVDGALDAQQASTGVEVVVADADGFSYYTVDFTYGSKTYSIPGDEPVALTDVLSQVGIEGDIANAEMSADAADKVEVFQQEGAWYIKGLQAFDTTHTLTVTMADGATYAITVTDDKVAGSGEASGSMAGADFLACAKDGEITLVGDVALTSTIDIASGKIYTIDLHGFTLTGTGSSSVITNRGTLALKDTNSTSSTHFFKVDSNGLWVLQSDEPETIDYNFAGGVLKKHGASEPSSEVPANDKVIQVSGGVITGGSAGSGGGVYNGSYAIFNMSGGTIVGCNSTGISSAGGGGVYISGIDAKFNMSGGAICGCRATNGGGVYSAKPFTLSGGTICGCRATNGGGVYNASNGTFTLSGGTITNCMARDGGGVHNGNDFTLSGGTISFCKATNGVGGGVYNKPSDYTVINMSGGTISGCRASRDGGGVYNGGQMTVGGKAKITGNTKEMAANNLCLPSGKTVSVNSPVSEMSIGVTLEKGTGPVTGSIIDANAKYFTSDNTNYAAVFDTTDNVVKLVNVSDYSDNKAVIVETGVGYDTVASAIGNANGRTVRMIANSTESVTVESGKAVTLDLNGKTLTGGMQSNCYEVIGVKGTLTLKDGTSGGGKITKNASRGSQRGVWVASGATFNMESGIIDGCTSTNGAGVLVSGGTFNMSGGTISSCTATLTDDGGGGVDVSNTGTFNMSGGTIEKCEANTFARWGGGVKNAGTFNMSSGASISECKALASGGGVYSTGTFNMSGGTISSCTAGAYSYGGGVYTNNDKMTVGGTAKITGNTKGTGDSASVNNLYLPSGKKVIVSTETPLVEGAAIGVTSGASAYPVAIADTTVAANAKYFKSDNTKYAAVFDTDSNVVQLIDVSDKKAIIVETSDYKAKVSDAISAATTGQTVKMLQDSTENVTVASGKTITLDLNGKTLTGVNQTGVYNVIDIESNGTLTLRDSASGGGKIVKSSETNNQRGVYVNPGAMFNMESGTISGCKMNSSGSSGGGVYNNGGTFNMSGGTISNCSAASDGGGVFVSSYSTNIGSFNMTGGAITNKCSAQYGGGVSVSKGAFTMSGEASITDCSATSKGGGVSVKKENNTHIAQLNMNGGFITSCSAADGGGVYVYCSKSGYNAEFIMSSGKISGCKATNGYGGGVYINSNGKFAMTNGTISNNSANKGGGVFNYATMSVSGTPKITGNTNDAKSPTANNVYLDTGMIIAVADVLTSSASIGVTLASGTGAVTSSNSADYSAYFSSDNTAYVTYDEVSEPNHVVKLKAAHTHSWTYSLSTTTTANDTITAKCEGEGTCDYKSEDTSLTIVKPALTISGRSESAAATLSGTSLAGQTSLPTIQYAKKNSEGGYDNLTAAPTAAGTYKASITVGEGDAAKTAYVEYEISTPLVKDKENETGYYLTVTAALTDGATNIHLLGNVTDNVTVASGKTVTLDLNGKTLKNTGAAVGPYATSTIIVQDTAALTLKDSGTGGTIAGEKKVQNGGGVYVHLGGTLNMEGGTISGNSVAVTGGGVYNVGTFNMSGGTISGNSAKNGGGVANEGKFTMTGGSITGNCATDSGGGVCNIDNPNRDKSAMTVSGAANISGNKNGTEATATASNVFLPKDKTITVSAALTSGASIGVTTADTPTAGTPVNITGANGTNDYSAFFTSDSTAYEIVENGTKTALVVASGIPVAKITNGDITKKFDTVQKAIDFASEGDTIVMLANSTENLTVASDDKVTLDLNGHVLKGTGSGSVITNAGTLMLKDSNAAEALPKAHYFTYVKDGAWTYYGDTAPESGKIDTIGTIDDDTKYVKVLGGVITGDGGNAAGGGVNNSGTLTLSGGGIVGCSANYPGGGVYSAGILTMSGGDIAGCCSSNSPGGGVYVQSGTFTMSSGVIVSCLAKYMGGGVYSNENVTFTMFDSAKISGCTSTGTGGGVYSKGTFTMSGNAVIADCVATGSGAGVENGGTFTMSGGTITGCTALLSTSPGGGVDNTGAFTMLDGSITNCATKSNGGGVYSAGTFTMLGGTISGCSCGPDKNGGGVSIHDTMTIGGTAKITNNTKGTGDSALVSNLYLPSSKTVSIGTDGAAPAEGMEIGVTLGTEDGKGTVTGTCNTDCSGYFTPDDSSLCTYYEGNVVKIGDPKAEIVGGKKYVSVQAAVNAATAGTSEKSVEIKMLADSAEDVTVASGKFITLDLAGHVLTGTGTEKSTKSVITNKGKLTITDSAPTATHTDSELPNGGVITSGVSGAGGGVYNKGTLTLGGGTIIGCTVTGKDGCGGGVYNEKDSSAQFTMNGGTITGCSAANGSGVYVSNSSVFTMAGGTITGCNAASKDGGVCVDNHGKITVSGKVNITGNKQGTETGDPDSNVYLSSGRTITVGEGGLKSEARIGVTTKDVPPEKNPVAITGTNTADYSGNFTADNGDYEIYNDGNVVKLGVHVHSWTYELSKTTSENDTVVATCGGGIGTCSATDTTLTIQASDATYDGQSHGASFGAAKTFCGENLPTITYEGVSPTSYTATADAPKDAGTYKASFKVGEGDGAKTASVIFTISQVQLTVSNTTVADKDWDGTKDATVTVGTVSGAVEGDDVTVSATGEFASSDVGTHDVSVTYSLTGKDIDNYSAPSSETLSATIKAVDIKDVKVAGYEAAYDGDEHTITVTDPSAATDTILYSTDGETYDLTEAPTYKDAGTNTVYVKVSRTGHNDFFASATVKIDKVQLTVSDTTADNKIYDGGTDTSATVGKLSGVVGSEDVSVKVASAIFADENAGTDKTVTVVYEMVGVEALVKNYIVPADGKPTANITARPVTLTSGSASQTYDGTELANDSVTDSYTGDTTKVGFVKGEGATYSVTGSRTDAGTSKNTFTYAMLEGTTAANYIFTKVEGDLTVNKATPVASDFDFSAPASPIVYDGNAKDASVVFAAASGKTGMGNVAIKYSKDEGTTWTDNAIDAGTYTVKISVAEGGNYEAASNLADPSWAFTIAKANDEITNLSCAATAYGTAPSPSCNVKSGGTPIYTYSASQTGEYGTWSTENLPGTYWVKASVAESANYNSATSDPVSFSVTALTITVTTHPVSGLTYNGSSQALGNVTADVEGCTITYKVDEGEYGDSELAATDASTYTVGYKVEKTGYATVESTFNVAIAKRSVTLWSASDSKTYDGKALTAPNVYASSAKYDVDGVFTSQVENLKATGTVTNVSEGSVANAITYTGKDVFKEGNYTIGKSEGTLSITAKTITEAMVSGVDASYTYTGSPIQPTVTVTDGSALKSGTDYDVTYEANTTVAQGGKVTVKGKGNYTGSVEKTFVIVKATPTITTVPTASAITYGQTLANSQLSGGAASINEGGTAVTGAFTWTDGATAPAVSDSGKTDYSVTFTPADTANYNTSTCNVKLTVNKATLTVTPKSNQTKVYDGVTAMDIGYTPNGAVAGQTAAFDGTLALKDDAKDAGTHEIVQGTLVLKDNGAFKVDNYSLSFVSGVQYTITPKTIDSATIEGIAGTYDYTGKAIKPVPTKVTADGMVVPESDYTVTYPSEGDYTAPGTYKVKIEGTGNFMGSAITTFTIRKSEIVYPKDVPGVKVDAAALEKVLQNAKADPAYKDAFGLTVELRIDKDKAPEADLQILKQTVGDKQITVNAVTLVLIVRDASGERTEDYGSRNTVIIPITYEFDFAGKTDVQAYRVHSGAAELLTASGNVKGEKVAMDQASNVITVSAMKYSTYAFTYTAVSDEPAVVAVTGDATGTTALAFAGLAAAAAAAAAFALATSRRRRVR